MGVEAEEEEDHKGKQTDVRDASEEDNEEDNEDVPSQGDEGISVPVVDMTPFTATLIQDNATSDEDEQGPFIEVGDNDSVSSLGSTDSFADDSSDDGDGDDRRRRRRQKTKGAEASPPNAPHNVRRRPGRLSKSRGGGLARAHPPTRCRTTPNMPRRQATREDAGRADIHNSNSAINTGEAPASPPRRQIQRSLSDSMRLSPDQRKDDADNNQSTNHGCNNDLTTSIHSLHHMDLWTNGNNNGEEDLHQTEISRGNYSSATGNNSGNNSRWSASEGTLNTAQLDQLSTVPRFPRRQRTGENLVASPRLQRAVRERANSHDSAPGIGPNHSFNKKRSKLKLPNRQKSFRKSTSLTMDQAAAAALAMAEGKTPNILPQEKSPSLQRRLKRQEEFVRQRSLPNLGARQLSRRGLSACGANDSLNSSSLHGTTTDTNNHDIPKLPERKASGLPNQVPNQGHSPFSAVRYARNARIRRARSDGAKTAKAHQIGKLLQDSSAGTQSSVDDLDDSSFANDGSGSYMYPGGGKVAKEHIVPDAPKIPQRQKSNDGMPFTSASRTPRRGRRPIPKASPPDAGQNLPVDDDDGDDDSSSHDWNLASFSSGGLVEGELAPPKLPERQCSDILTTPANVQGISCAGPHLPQRQLSNDSDFRNRPRPETAAELSTLAKTRMNNRMPKRTVSDDGSAPVEAQIAAAATTTPNRMPRRTVSNDDRTEVVSPSKMLLDTDPMPALAENEQDSDKSKGEILSDHDNKEKAGVEEAENSEGAEVLDSLSQLSGCSPVTQVMQR